MAVATIDPAHQSAEAGRITIFHNPACGTSRTVLEEIRAAGHEPRVVEYLQVGWRREELIGLLDRMGLEARELLRVRGTPAESLGLTASAVTNARILDAMVAHPVLVERPIVTGPRGAAVCRPAERVRALL